MASFPRVLRAKLYPPPMVGHLIGRPKLLAQLGKDSGRSLTLISAPAGYGKSTLVALWLAESKGESTWLSLDKDDKELRCFLTHFVAAIRSGFGQACRDTLGLLEAAELPAAATLARYLSNDLDALPGRLVLVLDDFHHADTREINELIDCLLRHPSQKLHLVVITRRDPALSLARLRATGGMSELRECDLRFDREETRAVIEHIAEVSVGERALDHLHKELEGWIVGLRLVCLALHGRKDPDAYLEKWKDGIGGIQDYLTEEVLARQPPGFQHFLMRASILDHFNAPLCEALCQVKLKSEEEPKSATAGDEMSGPGNGREFIHLLKDGNLFLVGLDPEGVWFRFHHQFQHFLQRQLKRRADADEIAALHVEASKWFEGEGILEMAVEHALAAGEMEMAIALVERYRRAELDEDRWIGVEKWLNQLPESFKRQRPKLLLAQAWVAYFHLQVERVALLVSQVDSLLKEWELPDPFWRAELNFFRAVVLYWEEQGEASARCCEEALALFGDKRGMLGGEVRVYLALARHLCGDGRMAIEVIEKDFRLDDAADFAFTTRILAARAFVHLLLGEIGPTIRVGQQLVTLAERWPSQYATAWGYFPQGVAHFHAHNLDDARDSFRTVVARRDFFEKRGAVDAFGGLMLTWQLMGRADHAAGVADELAAFARDLLDPECLTVEQSCRARLALLQGDLKTASAWARSVEREPHSLGMFLWLEDPAITLARVLIAEGRKAGLAKAAALLAQMRSQAEARHQACQLIDIVVLQAAGLERQMRPEEAMEALAEAVNLAQPGGWIRPFVEAGAVLSDSLKRLLAEESKAFFVSQILSASGQSRDTHEHPAPSPGPNESLIEPLTNRELDVLELLAERLYDKEIADRLSISPQTVRSHLKNIFGKLGVRDRRQAVTTGRQLGLLRTEG